jgi:hypothetical protein
MDRRRTCGAVASRGHDTSGRSARRRHCDPACPIDRRSPHARAGYPRGGVSEDRGRGVSGVAEGGYGGNGEDSQRSNEENEDERRKDASGHPPFIRRGRGMAGSIFSSVRLRSLRCFVVNLLRYLRRLQFPVTLRSSTTARNARALRSTDPATRIQSPRPCARSDGARTCRSFPSRCARPRRMRQRCARPRW